MVSRGESCVGQVGRPQLVESGSPARSEAPPRPPSRRSWTHAIVRVHTNFVAIRLRSADHLATHTITRRSRVSVKGSEPMPCVAPSEFVTPQTASSFGSIAETFIGKKYLGFVGRSSFFPSSKEDFQDISPGFGNVRLYMAFIKMHNPKLTISQLAAVAAEGLLKVPDLMRHDAAAREFYEIKPFSIDGVGAGFTKVVALESFYGTFGLPYVAGTGWAPNERVRIFSGALFGRSVEADFHFFRLRPGLIVYEICVEGQLLDDLAVIAALVAAIILIILSKGKIRFPVPGSVPFPIPTV